MKKVLCVLMLLVLLLTLPACAFMSTGFGIASAARLSEMEDDDLLYTVTVAMTDLVYTPDAPEGNFDSLNDEQRAVYCVTVLDMEVQNGGLCQFFVNSNRKAALHISEALAAIGATEHQALFEAFVQENGIDLADLSSFDSENEEEFAAQYDRYPFDAFDDAYMELPALDSYLTAYIRDNIYDIAS